MAGALRVIRKVENVTNILHPTLTHFIQHANITDHPQADNSRSTVNHLTILSPLINIPPIVSYCISQQKGETTPTAIKESDESDERRHDQSERFIGPLLIGQVNMGIIIICVTNFQGSFCNSQYLIGCSILSQEY